MMKTTCVHEDNIKMDLKEIGCMWNGCGWLGTGSGGGLLWTW